MDSEIYSYNLPKWLYKGIISDLGITEWLPIQQKVIPIVISDPHSDYFVNAPTGSGKTLAYALPIITILAPRYILTTKVLILLPTRDLADQVYQIFNKILSFQSKYQIHETNSPLPLVVETLERMRKYLKRYHTADYNSCFSQPDIIISTPGHLVDSINSYNFTMPSLEHIIFDEVDGLLEMDDKDPFLETLFHAIKTSRAEPLYDSQHNTFILSKSKIYPRLSKLCFSATKTLNPGKLAALDIPSPIFISTSEYELGELVKYVIPRSLTEYYLITPKNRKISMILYLVDKYSLKSGLIFTASLDNTEYVYKRLKEKTSKLSNVSTKIDSLSGRKSDRERRKILDSLKQSINNGNSHFVVSTDTSSRGIDIPNMDCVISFDIPMDMKNYIHRAGRTARAQRNGVIFTLIIPEQSKAFDEMIKKAQRYNEVEKISWDRKDLSKWDEINHQEMKFD